MKKSSHQSFAADMCREISRMVTVVGDRMIKIMLYARRDVDRSLNTSSILIIANDQEIVRTTTRDHRFAKER